MTRLRPFFLYYGAKWRAALLYPEPTTCRIIEPFAGAAGYSMLYPDRQVCLYDLDENIVATWDYLIHATEDEVVSLPDLEPGQRVSDLGLPLGPSCLVGWWLNQGASSPRQTLSPWGTGIKAKFFWGPAVRERIAAQLWAIRHWSVQRLDYRQIPNTRATWFIDPPYAKAGGHYRHGSSGIDFAHLALWCRSRDGSVIVCENDGADWLPFSPLAVIKSAPGRQRNGAHYSHEVMWQSHRMMPHSP